jgi:thiamine-monophosphate kinase
MGEKVDREESKRMTISDVGEKRLISEFIRPLYNLTNKLGGVGDDCAMVSDGHGVLWLFSTDRVPSDLTAFRLGILDYEGLGRYLACLNLSDIAACGGSAVALLLNLGLPNDLAYESLASICRAFGEKAKEYGCEVLGGDMTWSREISISATSIGRVPESRVLTRRGARPGDTVFASKPLGLTPAALGYHLDLGTQAKSLSEADVKILNGQFTSMEPELDLAERLSESGLCTSCMDNTDGVGQSLTELATASGVAMRINEQICPLNLVARVADLLGRDPICLAFSAGADFALVGTLSGAWTAERFESEFGHSAVIIGRVEAGEGVNIETSLGDRALNFAGWNYFVR